VGVSSGQSRLGGLGHLGLREVVSLQHVLGGRHLEEREKHLVFAEVVMLLTSEMPLVIGEGKNSPVNAIGISNRSGRLGWACFSQRH